MPLGTAAACCEPARPGPSVRLHKACPTCGSTAVAKARRRCPSHGEDALQESTEVHRAAHSTSREGSGVCQECLGALWRCP